MRVVTLKLDIPNDGSVRSSSIAEEVVYALLGKADQRTKDYLQVVGVKVGDATSTPSGPYFGAGA